VDRAPPADCDDAVARLLRGSRNLIRGNFRPARRRAHAEAPVYPPLARDEERPPDAQLGEHGGQFAQPPPDDHDGRCSRANATNARAARVSLRPLARASKISRTGSSPRTRAVAITPAARSASTARREMKVIPWPASTALRTDSCSPSSSCTSR